METQEDDGSDGRSPRDTSMDAEAESACPHITKFYYPTPEFRQFNTLELHKLRMNQDAQRIKDQLAGKTPRGRGRGKASKRGGGNSNAQISELTTTVAALASTVEKIGGSFKETHKNVKGMMKKLNYGEDDNSLFSSDDDDVPEKPKSSNRTNESLVKTGLNKRQKRST